MPDMMRQPITAIGAACLLMFTPACHVSAATTQAPAASSVPGAQSALLKRIGDDFYLDKAKRNPLFATFWGDSRFNDKVGLAISPKHRAQHEQLMRTLLERLKAVPRDTLGKADQTNYDILEFEIRNLIALAPFPDHLLPINQMMYTVPLFAANLVGGQSSQPLSTAKEYRQFLGRIKELTPWVDQAVLNMREGIQSGIVLPKALVVAALPQYQKLISATPEANVFYTPIKNMPAGISAADKRKLAAAYRREIDDKLNPALRRLAAFLETEYLPKARASAGIGALPNGKAWYAAHAAASTTTSLTPDQIHDIGLAEVARIQAEFAVLGPRMGYDGPAAGLPKWAGSQPKYRPFKTEQEILDVYRKLNLTLEAKLPALFTLRPKAPLEQRLEPELTRATASDHYSPPSMDGKLPGVFWSVVNDPTQYQSTRMTTLLMHEGSPGHHFQIALQQEMALPDFRKFGGHGAFIEGWALYAESLGKEMGMFDAPDQYFGHLNDELLRAARLVVDTGLHAKGWTREQAIQYLKDTNGYTDAVATNAVERYMAWPGQALSYKIGALKIGELRQRAADKLGPKFNLPAFHAVVLSGGTRPLSVLEADIERWIAEAK
jgi:uncharacterized protein (DUF885 family)